MFVPGISHPSGQEMNRSIVETSMARRGDLAHVLELLPDAFDQRSLAQQKFVEQRHELVLHPALEFRDQWHSAGLPLEEIREQKEILTKAIELVKRHQGAKEPSKLVN